MRILLERYLGAGYGFDHAALGSFGRYECEYQPVLDYYAAPAAPDFANGLFLTAANLGTALGSAVCGMVIAHMGMQYMMWGGIVFLILCLAMIIPRVYRSDEYVCLGESK